MEPLTAIPLTAAGLATTQAASQAGTGPGASAPATGQTTGQLLQPGEFLTLLVDSLKYQDPLNPTTTSDFLSQLASLSQVQTQVQIAATDQTAAANALIGRTVSGSDLSGKPLSGVVDSVALASGSAVLEVGKDSMDLSSVTSIGTSAAAASPSTAAPSTASPSTASPSTAGPAAPAGGATTTG